MLYLEGLKTRQAKEVLKFVDNDILPDLKTKLYARLANIESLGFDRGAATTRRIESMIGSFQLVTNRFKDISTRVQGELFALGTDEANFLYGSMVEESPVKLDLTFAPPEKIIAAITTKPFDGRTLDQWYERLAVSTQDRLAATIRRGVVEGQTTQQIVTQAMQGLQTTRKQTEAVVRSAVQHVSDAARTEFALANADVIKGEVWIATLDTRTCPRCAPLDGKVFQVGEGARPPLHVSCRCARSPIAKSWRELGFDIDDLDPTTRASMGGQVPKDITYNQWLKGQPLDVQEMALGKARARLFRYGGLNVDQFVNRNRVELTLDDIRKRESLAFSAAGLQ